MRALSLPELEQKLQLRKTKIYRDMAAGLFPKPIKVGRASRWIESEIDAWLLERAKARDQAGRETQA